MLCCGTSTIPTKGSFQSLPNPKLVIKHRRRVWRQSFYLPLPGSLEAGLRPAFRRSVSCSQTKRRPTWIMTKAPFLYGRELCKSLSPVNWHGGSLREGGDEMDKDEGNALVYILTYIPDRSVPFVLFSLRSASNILSSQTTSQHTHSLCTLHQLLSSPVSQLESEKTISVTHSRCSTPRSPSSLPPVQLWPSAR